MLQPLKSSNLNKIVINWIKQGLDHSNIEEEAEKV
jgi:hypothetical protein